MSIGQVKPKGTINNLKPFQTGTFMTKLKLNTQITQTLQSSSIDRLIDSNKRKASNNNKIDNSAGFCVVAFLIISI